MTITLQALAFDKPDRMRKSLRVAGITGGEMAEFLGVDGGTVSTWLNGKHKPSKMALRLWAQKTEVPLSWLENGTVDGVRPEGFEPPAYWSVVDPESLGLAA